MSTPSQFNKLRKDAHTTRVQDNIDATLRPVATALGKTPIMGAPAPVWITPDLTAGWGAAPPYSVPVFHKDALGYVHGQGVASNTTGGGLATVIYTLPIGYRPKAAQGFGVPVAGGAGGLSVFANGAVQPNAAVGAGSGIGLSFVFLAEQ